MNRFLCLLAILLFTMSCEKQTDLKDSGKLGGDPNIEINQVGNTFTPAGVKIGDTYLDVPASMEIIKSEEGVNTLKLVIDLTREPLLHNFNDMIPSHYKDSLGRINTEAKVKITSEGVLDYTNKDGKPFVAVKYAAKVGDQYQLTKSDGNTITRTITQKSTDDDFPWGFMYIKTTTVEQDSRIPGIQKIVYRFNHKFGLVAFEVHAEDQSVLSGLIYPQYP